MKPTEINLVPDIVNPTPDYYCTWQTQLYATNDGKPNAQRAIIGEKALFNKEKPYGWAYFYQKARKDLFLVMDDSWDVPLDNNTAYYGSLILNQEKFPTFTKDKNNTEALKELSDSMKNIGWKGVGGWVCAQESNVFLNDKNVEEYWKERLLTAQSSGFAYWKVDWGNKCGDVNFRIMLTELARKYAPNLVIEHVGDYEIALHSQVFRTYDVPAIASIPMTLKKIIDLVNFSLNKKQKLGLINCEDEAYIAAAGGFAMGIMRHPYKDVFMNGKADMSFPLMHRNLKTKIYEVIRAARFHRIAPAFDVDGSDFNISDHELFDTWRFENIDQEIEKWWFNNPLVSDSIANNTLCKSAPFAISRNTQLPEITSDCSGLLPYVVASKNPNGVYAVATCGRTLEREYFIPECDVTVNSGDSSIIGIFGEYNSLTLNTDFKSITGILAQDLADDNAFDITDDVTVNGSTVVLSGELIRKIGTLSQPDTDTSEPGLVIKVYTE